MRLLVLEGFQNVFQTHAGMAGGSKTYTHFCTHAHTNGVHCKAIVTIPRVDGKIASGLKILHLAHFMATVGGAGQLESTRPIVTIAQTPTPFIVSQGRPRGPYASSLLELE